MEGVKVDSAVGQLLGPQTRSGNSGKKQVGEGKIMSLFQATSAKSRGGKEWSRQSDMTVKNSQERSEKLKVHTWDAQDGVVNVALRTDY